MTSRNVERKGRENTGAHTIDEDADLSLHAVEKSSGADIVTTRRSRLQNGYIALVANEYRIQLLMMPHLESKCTHKHCRQSLLSHICHEERIWTSHKPSNNNTVSTSRSRTSQTIDLHCCIQRNNRCTASLKGSQLMFHVILIQRSMVLRPVSACRILPSVMS